MARFASRGRHLRLAPAYEAEGDLRRGHPVAGAGDRSLYSGIPAYRRGAAPAVAGGRALSVVRSLSPELRFQWQAPHRRQLRISPVPPDARGRKRPGRADRGLVRQPRGPYLRFGSGDRESIRAERLRMDVRLVRAPACRGEAAHGKRRCHARRASVRGPFLRLLEAYGGCSRQTTMSRPARIRTRSFLTTIGGAALARIRE